MADNFQNLSGNDFYPIRAQNIFDPQNFGVNMPSAPQQEPDMLDLIAKLYQPSNDLSDQFKQALSQMPQREHPGKLRQVGAALAGMSTFGPAHFYGGVPVGFSGGNPEESSKIQDQFLNAPYYKKLEDWKLKTGMLQHGAELEKGENINKRILAEQTAGRIIGNKRADIAAKTQAEKERSDRVNEEIRQKRASVYEFKAQHPNWIFKTEKGGNIYAINPQNPTMKLDTGIDSGTLSDLDKMNIGLDNKLEEIGATGSEQRKTENVKEENRQSDISARGSQTRQNIFSRGNEQRQTKQTPTPTQSKTVTKETKDATGKTTGLTITNTGFGNSQEAKKVRMKGPDGKIYEVPSDKVEEAKKNKMTVVQ